MVFTLRFSAGIKALLGIAKAPQPVTLRLVAESLASLTYTHDLRAKLVGLSDAVPFMVQLANSQSADKVMPRPRVLPSVISLTLSRFFFSISLLRLPKTFAPLGSRTCPTTLCWLKVKNYPTAAL